MSELTGSIGPIGCPFCGTYPSHSPSSCPMVESIEYYNNGAIKKIVKRDSMNSYGGGQLIWPTPDGKLK